ncbi:MAG: hypothetical protein ACLQME_13685 [Alphaproteobacteria bacterium]
MSMTIKQASDDYFSRTGRRAKNIKFMRIGEVSVCDQGASPGAEVILAKSFDSDPELTRRFNKAMEQHRRPAAFADSNARGFSEGDGAFSGRPNSQDGRDSATAAEELAAVVSHALNNAPGSRSFDRWVRDLFPDGEADLLYSDEIVALKNLWSAYRVHGGSLLKAMGEIQLNHLAERMLAADPKLQTFAKAYTAACRTPEGEILYAALRGRVSTGGDEASLAMQEIAKVDNEAQGVDDGPDDDSGNGDGGSDEDKEAAEAAAALDAHAERILKDKPSLGKYRAFTQAAQQHGDLYAKSYGRRRVLPERV